MLRETWKEENRIPRGSSRVPRSHAPTHEDGGADEIDVTDLSGLTRTSTIVVAASNSLDPTLAPGAYRCDGTADNVEMNAALVAAAAVNGRVELLEGDYNTVLALSVAINVALVGNGFGSVINFNAGGNAVTIAGDNVKLRDFKVVIVAGAGAAGTRPNCVYAEDRTNLEVTNLWLVGDETVADDTSAVRQCGIVFHTVTYSRIALCKSNDNKRHGITLNDNANNNTITGNTCTSNSAYGIILYLNNSNNALTGNICTENTTNGIALHTGGSFNSMTGNICNDNLYEGLSIFTDCYNNTVAGNSCSGNVRHGIGVSTTSSNNTVTGNTCYDNTLNGIFVNTGTINTVTGNTCNGNVQDGISIYDGSHNCTVAGNTCSSNTRHGMLVFDSTDLSVTGNTCNVNTENGIRLANCYTSSITGNTCNTNVEDGIKLDVAINNTIVGNTCIGNDSGNTGTFDGIKIEDESSYNIIHSNTCNDNDRWGISIGIAIDNCVDNWVKNNHLRGNTSGAFIDNGIDTKLATLQENFVHAVTATWVDPVVNTSPGGIDIDADDEIAMCHIKLPLELQLVVRIKIWAYSNVIEATNNMLLQINVHGATSSELWNTHAIDVVNHPSEETGGIVVGDVIHWVIDATDDADIAALAACDKLEILAVGEAASAPDIATDALFGVALIEYV